MEVNGSTLPVQTFDPDVDARVSELWGNAGIGKVISALSDMGCDL